MTGKALKIAISTVLAAAGVSWLLYPGKEQLSLSNCAPEGLVAELSLVIHGPAFWRVQGKDLAQRRQYAEGWDAMIAESNAQMEDVARQADAVLRDMYQSNPQLAPSPSAIAASRLRQRADEIEERAHNLKISAIMRERANSLRQCEQIVASRLR